MQITDQYDQQCHQQDITQQQYYIYSYRRKVNENHRDQSYKSHIQQAGHQKEKITAAEAPQAIVTGLKQKPVRLIVPVATITSSPSKRVTSTRKLILASKLNQPVMQALHKI